jgi:hypothetical protein
MITDIDIQLSKAENKLVLRMNLFERIFAFLVNTAMIFTLPVLTLSYTLQHLDTFKEECFGELMGNLVAFGFAYCLFEWLRKPTRLLKISGQSIEQNKLIAKEVLKEMGWLIEVEKADRLIARPQSTYQKQLTVILDRKDILLSSLRFGRSDAMMNYHSDGAETFKERFEAHVNAGATIGRLG